jgi:hypothetical protein
MAEKLRFTNALREALDVFTRCASVIIPAVLVLDLPAELLSRTIQNNAVIPPLRQMLLLMPIVLLLMTLGSLAAIRIADKAIKNETCGFTEAFANTLPLWPRAIWTMLLLCAGLTLATLLLVVPALICAVGWAFTRYAIVLRGESGWSALRYSWNLVRGNWWRVFSYVLIYLPVYLLNKLIMHLPLAAGIQQTFGIVTELLFIPYSIILMTILFRALEAEQAAESAEPPPATTIPQTTEGE